MPDTAWVIDDDDSIRWVLERSLTRDGWTVRAFSGPKGVLEQLDSEVPDVIITDIRMPGSSGLELMQEIHQRSPRIPVIVITAHTDLDSAVASYRSGAFEYLPKPFDVDEAVRLARRALEQREKEPRPVAAVAAVPELIGKAPAMQDLFRAIGRLSRSHVSVLLMGESGTGKELVARALHNHSPRAAKPFVAINIAAVPAELLESELFGHERGAFTGAHTQRKGRFEQANGGTLLLDEIGDMPADLQTRLLRVLADGRFYRVGGHDQVETDVRIIAATNQDLERRVREGGFREDLFHRLNVIRIDLPPLRQRREDIAPLAEHFLKRSAEELRVEVKQLDQAAAQQLAAQEWPGNVRQLENVCRWLTVMAPGQVIGVEDLPPDIAVTRKGATDNWEPVFREQVQRALAGGERELVGRLGARFDRILLEEALRFTGGHKQEAARRLGWGRNTLTRKLKELELDGKV
ncbi:MAG: nitrogen regulation protein NR(I) [Gammaproteobacteria bacterium]|nr:nitrogen regulation protein NR(I) [Gammaproteobacteria bacterium]